MKKCELLAPCGDLNCLYAAISNGATSVYFGGSTFNARMYANNFTLDNIKEAINYSHKRNVKVFITLNILIKDDELKEAKKYIDDLYLLGIDGIIVQDYGIINYINDNYPDLLLSCSTQTTIDDLESTLFFEELGANRVVLARECSIDTIKEIKNNSNIEIEVFAHGALCVCYSGQCLLSSYIGNRSGNRGKCAQPCRKQYTLINETTKQIIYSDNKFILSLKDLNTSNSIKDLLSVNIDSIKLEGRMKNPEYVANITKTYRNILDTFYDDSSTNILNNNLYKTFHRNFTKGYIFSDDIKNMNASKNNVGFQIGKVTNPNYRGYIEITLSDPLSQNDIIRFNDKNETSTKLVKLYDSNLKLTNKCLTKAYIKLNEKIPINTLVFKTFDYLYDNELKKSFPKDNYKLPINIEVNAKLNKPLSITINYLNYQITHESIIVEKASNYPITKEKIIEQISKLNDTPYFIKNIDINMDKNIYINIKELNNLRRDAINKLENEVLKMNRFSPNIKKLETLNINKNELILAFKVHTIEQYNYLKSLGYENIYYENNSTSKVNNDYNLDSETILARNYGSLRRFKDKNIIIDYSLNVYNHLSIYYHLKNGVKRIAPSIELSTDEYINLSKEFFNNYNEYPPLEFIAYTTPELMISKYCPLKVHHQCGKCHLNNYVLKDDYDEFILYTDNKCQMHLLANKKLNKIKDIKKIINYSSAIRLEFFNESNEEIKKIIDEVNHQLSI